jgi:hypothetical protein
MYILLCVHVCIDIKVYIYTDYIHLLSLARRSSPKNSLLKTWYTHTHTHTHTHTLTHTHTHTPILQVPDEEGCAECGGGASTGILIMCDGCDVCLCLDCAGLTQDTMPRESEVEFVFRKFYFRKTDTMPRGRAR